MPSTRTLNLAARGFTLAAAIVFTATSLTAQTATAAVPMPTGGFSLPPSSDPLIYTPTLAFDVTSVRETERGAGQLNMGIVAPPHTGQFEASTVTLALLIQIAYNSGATFQVAGGPDWLNDRYFRVQGKCDHSVDDTLAKLTNDQARLERLHMIQALLADRFHLKAHWETRNGSVYNLVIAKGGLKMKPSQAPPADADRPDGSSSSTSSASTGVQAHGSRQGIEIDGQHFNARAIGVMLSSQLRTPILDKTGLPATSYFDYALQFSRDESGTPDPDAYPSLFTALEEELGLKLEPGKGPVDTLVIDHAEMPSDN
jgi:uncharacterized protein (TIGR03435 family)